MKDTRFNLTSVIALLIAAALPIFFLPNTQEFFITNKLYLLAFGALLLLGISLVTSLVKRTLTWETRPSDNAIILFLVAVGLSVLVSSTNKVLGLLAGNFGFIPLASLSVLYFYLSRGAITHLWKRGHHAMHDARRNADILVSALYVSAAALSVIAVIYLFNPFKAAKLPYMFQFLQNPTFTPIGSQLDLIVFLGFVFVFAAVKVIASLGTDDGSKDVRLPVIPGAVAVASFIAILVTAYTLFKPNTDATNALPTLLLPPFRISWYAAVEILKNPLTALFGVGVNNFGAIFTGVKDVAYNQSPLWQIQTFTLSRSAILHILTETGVFGLLSFGLILFSLIKATFRSKMAVTENKALLIYTIIALAVFPPSLPVLALLYILAAKINAEQAPMDKEVATLHLGKLLPLQIAMAVLGIAFIGGTGYVLARAYTAELYYKKALDAVQANNGQSLYNNQRLAILRNPYIDRFRVSFAQTNLIIANNLAAKKSDQVTQADRETIAQAIQAAIAESKAAVTLNPTKASNWENLANIYRNVLNIAQGADVWTVSSYQRAILLDPQNPSFRLGLGGVYYSLENYDEAMQLFEQAVALKSDWSNAHYNLAWASYQKGDYKRAASEMQNVISLLNPARDQTDIERAQKDLEQFKSKIPPEGEKEKPTSEVKEEPKKLSLPTPPAATFSPKIQLPKEASPEAN